MTTSITGASLSRLWSRRISSSVEGSLQCRSSPATTTGVSRASSASQQWSASIRSRRNFSGAGSPSVSRPRSAAIGSSESSCPAGSAARIAARCCSGSSLRRMPRLPRTMPGDRMEGCVDPQRRTAQRQPAVRFAVEPLLQAAEQPRLADARLAADHDAAPDAGAGLLPCLDQDAQLPVAPDHGCAEDDRRGRIVRRARRAGAVDVNRLLDALEAVRAQVGRVEPRARQPVGRRAHHERPGLGEGLEPGRHVRRLAESGRVQADRCARRRGRRAPPRAPRCRGRGPRGCRARPAPRAPCRPRGRRASRTRPRPRRRAYTPMLPPSPVIVSVAIRWKSNMSSPNSSASIRCDRGVESTTSQNSTASWRRSPCAAGRSPGAAMVERPKQV